MLVIKRKGGQSITLRMGDIEVNIICDRKVHLCFDAPQAVRVLRGEKVLNASQEYQDDRAS